MKVNKNLIILLVWMIFIGWTLTQPASPAQGVEFEHGLAAPVTFSITPVSVTDDQDTYPTIDVDSGGKAHIAYVGGTGGDTNIYYGTNTSGSWVTFKLTSGGQFDMPSIAVEGSGIAHIAYSGKVDQGDSEIYYRNNQDGSWLVTPSQVTDNGYPDYEPSLSVDDMAKAHIAYRSVQFSDVISYATNTSGSWQLAQVVTDTINSSLNPSIDLYPSGSPHITYKRRAGSDWGIYYAKKTGGVWNNQKMAPVSDPNFHTSESIVMDGTGAYHIAYTSHDGNDYELFYGTNAAGSWASAPVTDNSVDDLYPSISLDSLGNVHIVYQTSDGDNEIYYATNVSGSWATSPVTANDSDDLIAIGSRVDRGLVIDGSDYAHITYSGNDGSDYEIYYAKSNQPVVGGGIVGTCANALPIACGGQANGDTTGKANNINAYDCNSSWDESGPEDIYIFSLAAGKTYSVTAKISNMTKDLDVFLLDPGACDSGGCVDSNAFGNDTATVDTLLPGDYFISVDGFQGAADGYTLELKCTIVGVAVNRPPNTPSNPSPAHQATGVSLKPTLTWVGGDPDGDTVTYQVIGGKFTSPTSDTWCTGTPLSCTLTNSLEENTKYLWQVIANDGMGGVTQGPFWEFTTLKPPKWILYLPLTSRK